MLYWEFGSGCVLPRTGVLMQNRGASFSLERGGANPLEPGRRPLHTLNPALAVLKDGRVIGLRHHGRRRPAANPGRRVQPPRACSAKRSSRRSTAPRWLLGRTWGAARINLRLEPRFDDRLLDRLHSAGHDVEVLGEPYSDVMGHAGAVVLHPDATCEGGHDPRADGGAAGV